MDDNGKDGGVGSDTTFFSSMNDQWLHQPHSAGGKLPGPASRADGEPPRANEAQTKSGPRANGEASEAKPIAKATRPSNRNLDKALSSVLKPKFANPFTPGGWMPGTPPARSKQSCDRANMAPKPAMRPKSPTSDDGSSLFVTEGLRDPHPEWKDQDATPRQHSLVDYSDSESSTDEDGEEDELEIVYAQDAGIANCKAQVTGFSSAPGQARSTQSAEPAHNDAVLDLPQDKRVGATPINPHVPRVSNKLPQSQARSQAQDTGLSHSASHAEAKKNQVTEKPPAKDPKSASATQNPRKSSLAHKSNGSHPQAVKRPNESGAEPKNPRAATPSANSMPLPPHHRGSGPSQVPSRTATDILQGTALPENSNSGGQKRLNRTLLQGRIKSEQQKRAQAQLAAKATPSVSIEHKKTASGPSRPTNTNVSGAKSPPLPASSDHSVASSSSHSPARASTEGKKLSQVESNAKNSTNSRDNPVKKQVNQPSNLPVARGSTAGGSKTAATSISSRSYKEHVNATFSSVDAPSKNSTKATDVRPTSKLNTGGQVENLPTKPTSCIPSSPSKDTELDSHSYKSDRPLVNAETVAQQRKQQTVSRKDISHLRDNEATSQKGETNSASDKNPPKTSKSPADEQGKKRKPLEADPAAIAKKTKINGTSAADTSPPNGVGILQIRSPSENSQTRQVSQPTLSITDRRIWEYIVYQKTWSTDENHSTASTFSRCHNLEDANAQAERLYKHTNAQHPLAYSIKFKGWKSSTPNTFGGVCYQGVYIFENKPTQLHHQRIWVSRITVEATEPIAPSTEFVTKSISVLRLFKLYTPPQIDASDSGSSSGSEAGSPPPQDPPSPIRQYQTLPPTTDEAYTMLEAANRAAKDLHIDMSFKILPQAPNPKDASFSRFQMDRKFQEDENRKLNDQLFALDPAFGGAEGCWESEFMGLDGEKYEVKVQRVGLTGPRNL